MARHRIPCGEVVLEQPVDDHVAATSAQVIIVGSMVQENGIASRGSAAAHESSPEDTVMQTCNPTINQPGGQSEAGPMRRPLSGDR
jgi:hypothetical protein